MIELFNYLVCDRKSRIVSVLLCIDYFFDYLEAVFFEYYFGNV